MKSSQRQMQSDDQKIEEIIKAFTEYALADIKFNLERPVAAFILASCLIDQLASFTYNNTKKNKESYVRFIKEYLPMYNSLGLYKDLRCLLVHNYSVGKYIALSTEQLLPLSSSVSTNANHITISSMYTNLEAAIATLSSQFRSQTMQRLNALERFKDSPTILGVDIHHWRYSEKEADYLLRFYQQRVVGAFINNSKDLEVTSLVKEKVDESEYPYIVKCIAKQDNYEVNAELDHVTKQLGMIEPVEVLKLVKLN